MGYGDNIKSVDQLHLEVVASLSQLLRKRGVPATLQCK
jgi:hypothetical protein